MKITTAARKRPNANQAIIDVKPNSTRTQCVSAHEIAATSHSPSTT